MSKTTTLSQLYGVDVSEFNVVALTKELFKDIDLSLYPPERVHFLVHALQFQTKLPSEKSMKRSEQRNKQKIAKRAGDTTPEAQRIQIRVAAKAARIARKVAKPTRGAKRVRTVVPAQAPPKPKNNGIEAFKTKSPQQIVLKSARKICIQQLQKWRVELKGALSSEKMLNEDKPLYFKKKKQCQKRRRLERRELIKDHKQKLEAIYGREIYSKNWRVGREEIKRALGLVFPDEGLDNVGEFMGMVDESAEMDF